MASIPNHKICFETIKIKNGKLQNLKYHQQRVNSTREFLGFKNQLDLNTLPIERLNGVLRVDYAENILSVTYRDLKEREFREFVVVKSDIEYGYKYANRDELDSLKVAEREIIIVKNGLLTDTTIANIALHVEDVWLTPKTALLRGTTRERLIDSGFLKCEDLTIKDLKKSKNFAIMNALIDFKVIKRANIDLGFNTVIQK